MTQIVNIKNKPTPNYDIYIGRENKWLNLPQSKWHNPFYMKNEGQRPLVILQYLKYLLNNQELLDQLPELENKILGCYCVPKRCHGNILIELLQQLNNIENGQFIDKSLISSESTIQYALNHENNKN